MDMQSRRPAPPRRAGRAAGGPDFAHGFCYLAPQGLLYFGGDRAEPVEWRPVVSVAREGPRCRVLPSTHARDRNFYRLEAARCFATREQPDQRDSYLCPRVEVIEEALLVKIGVLPHPERLALGAWLRERRVEDWA